MKSEAMHNTQYNDVDWKTRPNELINLVNHADKNCLLDMIRWWTYEAEALQAVEKNAFTASSHVLNEILWRYWSAENLSKNSKLEHTHTLINEINSISIFSGKYFNHCVVASSVQ